MGSGQGRRVILVIDDDENAREILGEYLRRSGYRVMLAGDAQSALGMLDKESVDLVVTDLKMPGMDGIELVRELKRRKPYLMAVVMSGYGTVKSAVRSIKAGAFDYITKPFDFDDVSNVVRRAFEFSELKLENEGLKRELQDARGFDDFAGYSRAMQKVFSLVRKVAGSDVTVLVRGESGTGKELVARTIHENSPRAGKPMVTVNCGAIPGELLESELFGHEKGAFTGATRSRMGRFEMAHGGTIFLDEVGDMSPNLQVKLLRVLQEQEFERVGGEKTIKVDARVIAATNQDLEKMIAGHEFREDLYYRLNVIQVKLPPLRERLDDLPLLTKQFLKKYGRRSCDKRTSLSSEVMEALKNYSWPGNVRELKNVIERACILKGEGEITLAELPDNVLGKTSRDSGFCFQIPPSGIDFNETVGRFETDLIVQALTRSDGVKNRAARLLGLGRTTLVEKMKRKRLISGADRPQNH